MTRKLYLGALACRSSFLALSCVAPGYAVLLLMQGIGMVWGVAIPLPEDLLLCALVLALDGVRKIASRKEYNADALFLYYRWL